MTPLCFPAASVAATDRLGALLAELLPAGTVVALSGTLGAGKTRLVQALAAACGIEREEVVSPTFVLCQQYIGRRTIYHLDAYRLRDEDEFRELGTEEMFDSGALVVIEWAEKVAGALPAEYVAIEIRVTGAESRAFEITTVGNSLDSFRSRLAERLAG
jgi:tRNA threonylcarbamoyladenosine biosynthesis protein TsaE